MTYYYYYYRSCSGAECGAGLVMLIDKMLSVDGVPQLNHFYSAFTCKPAA